MAVVMVAMGGYGSWLGWQLRNPEASIELKKKARTNLERFFFLARVRLSLFCCSRKQKRAQLVPGSPSLRGPAAFLPPPRPSTPNAQTRRFVFILFFIQQARDLHPKLLGGVLFFFALGASGGVLSLVMQARAVWASSFNFSL